MNGWAPAVLACRGRKPCGALMRGAQILNFRLAVSNSCSMALSLLFNSLNNCSLNNCAWSRHNRRIVLRYWRWSRAWMRRPDLCFILHAYDDVVLLFNTRIGSGLSPFQCYRGEIIACRLDGRGCQPGKLSFWTGAIRNGNDCRAPRRMAAYGFPGRCGCLDAGQTIIISNKTQRIVLI